MRRLRFVPQVSATTWLMAAGYLAISLYFTMPLLTSGQRLGIADWDPLLFYHASVIRSLYEYAQLPFWNPWYCGGDVLWQNPQVPLISPAYLFLTVVSLPFAMKLTILVDYLVGFAGMHLLLRRIFRVTFLPAVFFLASLFVLGGGIAFHLTVGHTTFLPYFYLPWILFCYLRAIESGHLRYTVGAAGAVALALYGGGIHIAFMAGVALAFFALTAAAGRRDWRPVLMLAMVGILAALFAAPKLLPTALFFTDPGIVDVRAMHPHNVMSMDMLLHSFLDPFQYLRQTFSGQNYGWHEYGNYIGSFAALLIGGSFVMVFAERPWRREHWLGLSLALTSVFLFLVTIGEFAPWAPYVLLSHLPLFDKFRLPSRYTLVFLLFATAMVAWTVRGAIADSPARGAIRRYAAVVLVLGACFLAWRNRIPYEVAFPWPPLQPSFRFLARPPAPTVDAVTDGFSDNSPMLRAMMANRAVLRCDEPFQLRGAIQPERPVVFSDGRVMVSRIAFTPNRITFGAVSLTGGRVYLNERYARGWHSSAGPFTVDPASRLAYVTLPAGTAAMFTFWFAPPGLIAGLVLLAGGILLSFLIWNRTLAGAQGRSAPATSSRQS